MLIGNKKSSQHRQKLRAARSSSSGFTSVAARGNHGSGPVNAKRAYERYLALAQAAALTGDTVESENCYQHAEHYFRLMKGQSFDETS